MTPPDLPRETIAGVPVDAASMRQVVDTVLRWTDDAAPRVAVGVNAHVSNLAARDREFRERVASADLAYADGQSVVWAANLLRHPVPERVATTDLVFPLMAACAERGIPVWFHGGAPGVAERAADRLRERYPGLLVRTSHGFVTDDDMPAVVDEVRAHGTKVLLVGLGDPLQQAWVARYRDRLGVPAILTCGGLFDWTSGDHRRAPSWMIKAGLEWLWRLLIEPRRLAKRYLAGNPVFVARVARQALRGGRRPAGRGPAVREPGGR